jgi:hypothetical protein
VDEKTEFLGNALGVSAMMALGEVEASLADLVEQKVKINPKKDLITLLSDPGRLN